MVSTPPDADWVAVTDGPLPLAEVFAWVVHPGCGAVVSFCGTVRDHSEGRPNVVSVEYESGSARHGRAGGVGWSAGTAKGQGRAKGSVPEEGRAAVTASAQRGGG